MCSAFEFDDSSPRTPKNVFWIETLHLALETDIISMAPGNTMTSQLYRFTLLNDAFRFRILKVTPADILITCFRHPCTDPAPDNGYILRFKFSLVSMDELPKSAEMPFNVNQASVLYKTDSFLKKIFNNQASNYYIWHLKIVIKMIEYNNAINEQRKYQEKMFQEAIPKFCKSEIQSKDMAYVLKRPGLTDIFSGRQDDDFAKMKLSYIARASTYSKELAEYFTMKSRRRTEEEKLPSLDFSEILNYILNGKKEPIKKEDIFVSFLKSWRYGLTFMTEISIDYMIQNLEDLTFLVDVMQVASLVDDESLFSKAVVVFAPNIRAVEETDKWKEVVEKTGAMARSIVYDSLVYVKSRELLLPSTSRRS